MLHSTDLPSLETSVRDHLTEPTARAWPQAQIFRAINDEYAKLCRMANQSDQWYFDTTISYTLTGVSVTLPRNFHRLRNASVYRDGTWYPIQHLQGPHELYQFDRPDDVTKEAQGIRFEGRTMVLEPGYANISSLKLYYSRVPAPLAYGTAAAGAATTITLATGVAIDDDVYIGDEIVTLTGTGSGQRRTITDYAGSTRVATVATWGTNPDTTTTYSTVLATPIDQYPELVVLGAAYRLLLRRRDTEMVGVIKSLYNEELQRFREEIKPRQSDQVRYVNYIVDDWEDT